MTKYIFHIGAHKTGTTYVQEILKNNANYLYGEGFCTSTPADLRSFALHRLESENDLHEELRLYFAHKALQSSCHIVSDENIAGTIAAATNEGGFYRKIDSRLVNLLNRTGAREYCIYFCIRSTIEFLASAYCELIRNNGYIHFEEYKNSVNALAFSWIPIILRIESALEPKCLNVYEFESFKKSPGMVINLFTERELDLDMQKLDSAFRKSPSSLAIQHLNSYKLESAVSPSSKMVEEVYSLYGNCDGRFDPFTDSEKQQLSTQFENDLVWLRSRENIRYIDADSL